MPEILPRPVRTRASRAAACAAVLSLALIALLGAVCLSAGPAAAAGKVQVSVDERTWSDELPRRLFDSVERVVPGDWVSDAIWVRNVTADPLDVAVQMRWIGPEAESAFDDVLTIGMNGRSVTVGQLKEEPLTVRLGDLGPDEVARLEAEAHLLQSAGNATEQKDLEFELVLQLSAGSAPSPGPSDSPSDDPSSDPSDEAEPPQDDDDSRQLPLPRTGTEALLLVIAGLVVIGAGIAALLASRRRRTTDEDRRKR
ncbi:LPXTG cell wall anchor domain-containing protein [Brevibacterium otitidis]|uniref:LPXTG cell wall anchor domain-containing protein n=1 Tax=Brevibacterium otitidis TaxID=53364 RepID=A0ABV5WZ96_9MICO|nr:hypothetical protein GCM10023233_24290 [Brevibacterium otitidis]